jgi:hypothetical protein
VNVVSENGKPCTTVFERVSTNGLTSVVKCKMDRVVFGWMIF